MGNGGDQHRPATPWWALGILAIAAVIRLAALDLHGLWLDEATSLQFAGHDLKGCLLAEVNNPPLFRLLLHGWLRLGDAGSDTWVRLLPALLGVLACVAFWRLARRVLSPTPALIALALLALNPYHLLFSQEVRAYSLLILLGVLALWLHLETLERPRRPWRLVALAVVLVAGLHTHYLFAWLALVLGGHRVLASRRGPWREALARLWPLGVAGLAFVPWVVLFLSRVGAQQRGYTTDLLGRIASLPFMLLLGESAAVRQYPQPFRQVALEHLWVVIPFAVVAAPLLVWGVRRLWAHRAAGRVVLAAGAVPLLGLALLFPIVPLFTARYLSFLIPVVCLVVAAAWLAPRPRLAPVALGGLLLLQLVSLGRYHFDPAFGREDWRGAARYAERHTRPGTTIVFDKRYVQIPFDRYYRGGARRVGLREGRRAAEAQLEALARRSPEVVLVRSHTWDTGRASLRALERRLCRRAHRVFRRSNGVEVHVFGPCPKSRLSDEQGGSMLARTSE